MDEHLLLGNLDNDQKTLRAEMMTEELEQNRVFYR
jgi:hypothetical protein